MKLAIVGDTHGNMSWVCNDVIPYAVKHGVDKIVQVGDFGFVWPDADYPRNLHKLNRVLDRAGLDMHFLPGNHEDHHKLLAHANASPTSPEGHHRLRSRIFYTGRVAAWSWAGCRIAVVGGAVSIDRDYRQRYQRRTGTAIWWREEQLTPTELATAAALDPVDVLLTHDAPTGFPTDGLKEDLDSTAYRQAMTTVGRALQPRLWFHGHYHVRLIYPFRHDGGECEVHALDCDHSPRTRGIALLDLAELPARAAVAAPETTEET